MEIEAGEVEVDDWPRPHRPLDGNGYARVGRAVIAQAWLDAERAGWFPCAASTWLLSAASRFWCEVADLDHDAVRDVVRRKVRRRP